MIASSHLERRIPRASPRQLMLRPSLQQAPEQDKRRLQALGRMVGSRAQSLMAQAAKRLRYPNTRSFRRQLLEDNRTFCAFHQVYKHSTQSYCGLMNKIHKVVQYHQSRSLPCPTHRGPSERPRCQEIKSQFMEEQA